MRKKANYCSGKLKTYIFFYLSFLINLTQMKPFKLALLLLVAISLSISCKKVIETKVMSSISFKMDNVLKQKSGDKNVMISFYKEQNILQVIGNIEGSQAISLMINEYHGVGTYSCEEDLLATYSNDVQLIDNDTFVGVTGTLKITSATDTFVKGEFQFNAETISGLPKIFTEGKFEGKIIKL